MNKWFWALCEILSDIYRNIVNRLSSGAGFVKYNGNIVKILSESAEKLVGRPPAAHHKTGGDFGRSPVLWTHLFTDSDNILTIFL